MKRGNLVSANTSWECRNTRSNSTLFLQLGWNRQIYWWTFLRYFQLQVWKRWDERDTTSELNTIMMRMLNNCWSFNAYIRVRNHSEQFFVGKGIRTRANYTPQRHGKDSFPVSENSQTAISQSHLLSGSPHCHRRSPSSCTDSAWFKGSCGAQMRRFETAADVADSEPRPKPTLAATFVWEHW